MNNLQTQFSAIKIEKLKDFVGSDLSELCDAAESVLDNHFGFNVGMNQSPSKGQIESYFKGVLMIDNRDLFIARLDGVIAGSIQLIRPSSAHSPTCFSAVIDNHFVAPWARGLGLAGLLLEYAEKEAKAHQFKIIKLSVKENNDSAIKLYENSNYVKWGVLEKYEIDEGEIVAGYFYYKDLI